MARCLPARLSRTLTSPLAAMATALLCVASLPAKADTYDLTASITSFRSWIPTDSASWHPLLGTAPLSDSGVSAGSYKGDQYDWSDTVALNAKSITFGYDPAVFQNPGLNGFSVATAGQTVKTVPGVKFSLATLTFTNGQWFYKADVGVHFVATDQATGKKNVYDDTVEITTMSSNAVWDPATKTIVYDPYAEADYFTLLGHPEFGSVRVFDTFAQPPPHPGNVGSILFVAKIGSLDPLGFTNPTGGAFVDSSVGAGLNDPHGSAGAVPEPSTWAMMLIGFAGIGFAGYRASRKRSLSQNKRVVLAE